MNADSGVDLTALKVDGGMVQNETLMQFQADIRANWAEDKRWEPNMDDAHREKRYRKWKKAVTKTFDWVDEDD